MPYFRVSEKRPVAIRKARGAIFSTKHSGRKSGPEISTLLAHLELYGGVFLASRYKNSPLIWRVWEKATESVPKIARRRPAPPRETAAGAISGKNYTREFPRLHGNSSVCILAPLHIDFPERGAFRSSNMKKVPHSKIAPINKRISSVYYPLPQTENGPFKKRLHRKESLAIKFANTPKRPQGALIRAKYQLV